MPPRRFFPLSKNLLLRYYCYCCLWPSTSFCGVASSFAVLPRAGVRRGCGIMHWSASLAGDDGTTITTGGNNDSEDDTVSVIRVLALHGSEGSAKDFERTLVDLREPAFLAHGSDWQITALDAPFPKGKGYAWWTLPAGERSFTASEYPGFEESAALVQNAITSQEPFDLVLAHSQGSILATALLALDRFPHHPRLGYVLNGGAWPNPYTKELENLQFTHDNDDDDEEEQEVPSSCPRVLVVTGEKDQINPPASQVQVQEALAAAGASVTMLRHSGGHAVPTQNTEAVTQLVDWVAKGIAKAEVSHSQ